MELNDDQHFEKYLRQFQPISPNRRLLPYASNSEHDGMMWLTAVAAIWVIVALLVGVRDYRRGGERPVTARESQASAPLTLSKANLQLAKSKSVKAALDEIAFHQPAPKLPVKSRSALEVLGKEKTRL